MTNVERTEYLEEGLTMQYVATLFVFLYILQDGIVPISVFVLQPCNYLLYYTIAISFIEGKYNYYITMEIVSWCIHRGSPSIKRPVIIKSSS